MDSTLTEVAAGSANGARAFPFLRPTMLAPMEGVTSAPMRAYLASFGGLGVVCTEFFRVHEAVRDPVLGRRAVQPCPGVALSVQLMGNEPEKMAAVAAEVAAAGADVVDVNCGCPAPRVVRKGVGSALLGNVPLLRELLGSMRRAVPGLFSAKVRPSRAAGDDPFLVLDAAVGSGVDFLVLHPRTSADGYAGVADHRLVRAAVERYPVPVVANGDIWYAEEAVRLMELTGCAAVMMGRPALRNPWLFRQVQSLVEGTAAPEPDGRALCTYIDGLHEVLTRRGAPDQSGPLKEYLRYLLRATPVAELERRELLGLSSTEVILGWCREHLEALEPSQLDLSARPRAPREPRVTVAFGSPMQRFSGALAQESPHGAAAPIL